MSREVPVHPTLAAMLAEWKLGGWSTFGVDARPPLPDDLVLPNERGAQRQIGTTQRSMRFDMRRLGIGVRRLHGMRHTFISLAIDGGARHDVISKVTHTRPVNSAFDAYREEAWGTLCAEVLKIQIERQPDVQQHAVAASGGGNATDSATAADAASGSVAPHGAADGGVSYHRHIKPRRFGV